MLLLLKNGVLFTIKINCKREDMEETKKLLIRFGS